MSDFAVRGSEGSCSGTPHRGSSRSSVGTTARTWDGDRLDGFIGSLAEDFRGWEGQRTWHSLSYDLTLAAEHRAGGHVHLT
ncbi:hypothetical protein GPA10_28430 [Streptomyces sp. p1417]|uniref:Uncharacterized protein n=1 Tax=Streptomyces typhae TaxID=2681492 RepID=A0A6L6X460_9ACTN|nr:hypothetical protein [Streptomyces typhae]